LAFELFLEGYYSGRNLAYFTSKKRFAPIAANANGVLAFAGKEKNEIPKKGKAN
jgi:hypothetical protein